MSKTQSISACLVVRDVEPYLERCLRSLAPIVDEIVLAHDGECGDRSLEIAETYGARVSVRPFVGEAEAHRAFTFEQARGDWILRLDADEYLPEETIRRIPELVERPDVDAYAFRWPAFDGRRPVERGPFSRLLTHCLFRRSRMYFLGITHLAAGTYGRAETRLDILVEHRPADDNWTLEAYRNKFLPWCRIEARQLLDFERAPRFRIDPSESPEHPELRRCRRRRDHPFISCVDELGGWTWLMVRDGLLVAGWRSWKMYLLVALRTASAYLYVLKYRRELQENDPPARSPGADRAGATRTREPPERR